MSAPTNSKFAWVEKHASKLPTLHKGELTPLIIDEFDLAITNFMTSKDIPSEKQRKRLIGLTLPEFLKEVKEKFLDNDWETQVRTDILSMRQTSDQSLDEFATSLIGHTSLLADTTPIPETQIRLHLEAGMSDDLRFVCLCNTELRTLVSKDTTTLAQYIRAVNRIDEEHRRTIAESNKENKRGRYEKHDDNSDHPQKRHQNTKASSSTSSRPPPSFSSENPFPPKLSDAERDLLCEHEGCNRCRIPYVGHRSEKCAEPMTAAGYFNVTEKLCLDARKAHKGKAPATAPTASTSKPAAIVPPAVFDSDSSVDTDPDLSREDVSHKPSPPSVPHLLWSCLIDGHKSPFPVNIQALIDNGAHLVIINEALVNDLNLPTYKLHRPESVSLALSDSSTPTSTLLTRYVKLQLHSLDQAWTSTSVRALVAPDLCAPIILGLPWLQKNHIVIDHNARTVVDKRSLFDLMNPPEPKTAPAPRPKLRERLRETDREHKTMLKELNAVCDSRRQHMENNKLFEEVKPVDVIAAVREHVEILAHWDELNKRAEDLKTGYKKIFEPMPHTDDLPTDVYFPDTVVPES
ncbi:hypothetical protein DFH07DRAFT_784980 [Mycena maculata]|uniref:Uncharacterized protein n=1 Tax=Mycena maculata TaxID=230809 RepID=A0AAD7MHX4_9AGAR|nr:hypothetical protein DFH07DRAFT_784980 [Mycena maculata]